MKKKRFEFPPAPLKWRVAPGCMRWAGFVLSVPERFHAGEGTVMFRGRNELRKMTYGGRDFVVKSFHRPNFINRWVYGVFRESKAQRSYEYGLLLVAMGINTPFPIGYVETRRGGALTESYYVSLLSSCPYTYEDLFRQRFEREDEIVRAVGATVARMHEYGFEHKDLGRGNILFDPRPEGVRVEIIDLNRMRIRRPLRLKRGCRNLERLPATPRMHRVLAEAYAKARSYDAEECYRWITAYRKRQPGKINDLLQTEEP